MRSAVLILLCVVVAGAFETTIKKDTTGIETDVGHDIHARVIIKPKPPHSRKRDAMQIVKRMEMMETIADHEQAVRDGGVRSADTDKRMDSMEMMETEHPMSEREAIETEEATNRARRWGWGGYRGWGGGWGGYRGGWGGGGWGGYRGWGGGWGGGWGHRYWGKRDTTIEEPAKIIVKRDNFNNNNAGGGFGNNFNNNNGR